MLNVEQLLDQNEKSIHRKFSVKTLFLKCLQYSQKNTYEIYINANFEEYLLMAASEPALWDNCFELRFWIAFKTILTR